MQAGLCSGLILAAQVSTVGAADGTVIHVGGGVNVNDTLCERYAPVGVFLGNMRAS